MMNEQGLKTAMQHAMRTTENAAALGLQLSAGDLHRATVARRLSDAHERAVREAKALADASADLVATLQCGGIGARLAGHRFAPTARKVSGALLRLAECREVFQAMQAQQRVAGLLAPASANVEEDEKESDEEVTGEAADA
jgi:hypothetical protein